MRPVWSSLSRPAKRSGVCGSSSGPRLASRTPPSRDRRPARTWPLATAADLRDLLGLFDPLTDLITDFVEITTVGSDSHVKVDADGGANSFVQIATLKTITGLTDEEALVTSGHLLAA